MPRTDPAAVRREFVEIAARRFATDGFAATSLREIAEDAGYTKAALLYHFESKDALLAEVAEIRIGRLEEILDGLERLPAGPDRSERAAELLVGYLVSQRPVPALVLNPANDLLTALHRLPAAERMERVRHRTMDLFIVGGDGLERRVRVAAAFAGLHAAVAEYPDADATELSHALIAFFRSALRDDLPTT